MYAPLVAGFSATNNQNPSLSEVGTTKNVATQVLQGVGPVSPTILNTYNLDDLEKIASQWTANLVQKAAEKETKLQLGCVNNRELFVDTVTVTFPRIPDFGLGLHLQEIAGGREDGLGITVVTGLVMDGPASASGADIFSGDSIASVSILRTRKGDLEEVQQVTSVDTECLGYDATVSAISSDLPQADRWYEDVWRLTLRRLRRKPVVTVNLQYPPSQRENDVSIQLFAGENLRQAMLVRNIKLNDELAQRFDTKSSGNCGAGGLCRTCSVVVVRGSELLNPARIAEKTMLKDNPRWRLACKAIVGYGMKEGEMTIRVNPNQW
jgi:ferredoxin